MARQVHPGDECETCGHERDEHDGAEKTTRTSKPGGFCNGKRHQGCVDRCTAFWPVSHYGYDDGKGAKGDMETNSIQGDAMERGSTDGFRNVLTFRGDKYLLMPERKGSLAKYSGPAGDVVWVGRDGEIPDPGSFAARSASDRAAGDPTTGHFSALGDPSFPRTVFVDGKTYFATGKTGTNIRSGQKSAEYEFHDDRRGWSHRVWRQADGSIEAE